MCTGIFTAVVLGVQVQTGVFRHVQVCRSVYRWVQVCLGVPRFTSHPQDLCVTAGTGGEKNSSSSRDVQVFGSVFRFVQMCTGIFPAALVGVQVHRGVFRHVQACRSVCVQVCPGTLLTPMTLVLQRAQVGAKNSS